MKSKWQTLFSSQSSDWRTPDGVYLELWEEFRFTFDPCPIGGSKGLEVAWKGSVYVNPPYGRGIDKWLKKGVEAVRSGTASVVVFLLPARTDTKWFHEWVLPHAKEIRFIRGRLRFSGHATDAPFPSMVIVYG